MTDGECVSTGRQESARQNKRIPLYHELLSSQTDSIRAALDEQRGGTLRGTEVWQNDLSLSLLHNAQEVCSVLPQQKEMLLGGDIQLAAYCPTWSVRSKQEVHQDAGRLLLSVDSHKSVMIADLEWIGNSVHQPSRLPCCPAVPRRCSSFHKKRFEAAMGGPGNLH